LAPGACVIAKVTAPPPPPPPPVGPSVPVGLPLLFEQLLKRKRHKIVNVENKIFIYPPETLLKYY
jgi:hypothetical protein